MFAVFIKHVIIQQRLQILQAPITSGDGKNTNFLSDFIESIRESLGVEPSTASADLEDDQIDQAINDRLSQEQVDIG